MKIFATILLALSFPLFSCHSGNSNTDQPVIVKLGPIGPDTAEKPLSSLKDPYDLKNPTHQWRLPQELVEVSGNTWVDANHLILIEDQHAILYYIKIDGAQATLENKIEFKKGETKKFDIEDVTIVNNVVYALWSHGTIFRIDNWKADISVQEMETGLTAQNNTEGLCYDPVTGNLLIACKKESGLKNEKKSTKAVYQFNLQTKKLEEKPFLVIHEDGFKNLVNEKIKFNPSAIAVHPQTKDIYLLSTEDNKCMAVFNREGKLISFQFIDKDLMPQPEGICFSPDGKLYISSEGKKGEPGNLFEFDAKK